MLSNAGRGAKHQPFGLFLLATDLLACARTGPPCCTVPWLRTIGPSSRGARSTCGGMFSPTLSLASANMAGLAASRAAGRAFGSVPALPWRRVSPACHQCARARCLCTADRARCLGTALLCIARARCLGTALALRVAGMPELAASALPELAASALHRNSAISR